TPAQAHEMRPGYLELKQTGEETYDVLWKVPAAGTDMRLGIHLRLPAATEETREHRALFIGGAFVERWSVRHPGGLADQTIHIDGLGATMTDVLVRVERLDGTTLVNRIAPTQPSLLLAATPSMWALAGTYFTLGVEHILGGIDHLLFVLALLMLVKGGRRLFMTITAFTLAHSITLAAATLGWLNVPVAPVEAVIALSIVFVAAEIVHGLRGREGLTARSPWIVALVFGLLHGLGFASALSEVGLPGHAIPVALFLFNVGVEAGQLLFVAAALVLLALARRVITRPPTWAEWVPAYCIGAVAMYWTLERVSTSG
ncbi:MAG: hydrogenase/urease accessory protein HupE, partial [Planctomycetota bacterium]